MRRFLIVLRLMNVMMFRNRTALFFSLILPTVSLVLFGLIFGNNKIPIPLPDTHLEVSYSIWLLPGIIVTNMMASGLMGTSGMLIAWRERGIFRRIAVTPTPISEVMLARVCTQVWLVIVQAVLAIIISTFVFNFSFNLSYTLITLVFIALGAIVFLAFGQVIASFTERVEVGNIIGQVIYMIGTFLTGIMLPLSILPPLAQSVAKYTPSYMIADLLRPAMLSGTAGAAPLFDILGLFGYLVAAIAVSSFFFKTLK